MRHSIAFKKLTIVERDELWGIDKNGTTYRYFEGAWIPLLGERVREIHAGRSGVLMVSLRNSLYKREGVSHEKPQGSTWSPIELKGKEICSFFYKAWTFQVFMPSLKYTYVLFLRED